MKTPMRYRFLLIFLIILCSGSLSAAGEETSPAAEQAATKEPPAAPEKAPAPQQSAAPEKVAAPDKDTEEEAAPAPTLTPWPIAIPKKSVEIRSRYALGLVFGAPSDLLDDHIRAVVLAAYDAWQKPIIQVAWYATGKKAGQGVLAVGECRDGEVSIARPKTHEEAVLMEQGLSFPTSPTTLCRAYLENEITADDDFRGKAVVFEAPIADIARGAFSRPYAFFPSAESSVTGLTCYFSNKDPNLRKIRKGLTVKVRGTVKGFLMQDVVLEDCDILAIRE